MTRPQRLPPAAKHPDERVAQPPVARPPAATAAVLALQRSIGNAATGRLLSSATQHSIQRMPFARFQGLSQLTNWRHNQLEKKLLSAERRVEKRIEKLGFWATERPKIQPLVREFEQIRTTTIPEAEYAPTLTRLLRLDAEIRDARLALMNAAAGRIGGHPRFTESAAAAPAEEVLEFVLLGDEQNKQEDRPQLEQSTRISVPRAARGSTPASTRPPGSGAVAAVATHRGEMHAALIERSSTRTVLQVHRFDERRDKWRPVAKPLNTPGTFLDAAQLLSVRGELHATWLEHDPRARASLVVVARLAPDGGSWERVMQTPAAPASASPRLAQVGDQPWVGWSDAGIRMAQIRPGGTQPLPLPADALPPGAALSDMVGYNGAAYVAYKEQVLVPAHHDNESGRLQPAHTLTWVRVARITPAADPRGMGVTELDRWPGGDEPTYLSAGTADAPARPAIALSAYPGFEIAQLRDDEGGFDRIPVDVLKTLIGRNVLRGITATPAGIAIALQGGLVSGDVGVYTINRAADDLTITEGEELPDIAANMGVRMAPTSDGTILLGYTTRGTRDSPPHPATMRHAP